MENSPPRRLDIGSFGGLLLAVGCIVCGLILEGGKLADAQQGTAALIVFGGTAGAVLVSTPLAVVMAAALRLLDVFSPRVREMEATLATLLKLSEGSRRKGVIYLESAAREIADPFFRKAVDLVADGAALDDIREVLEIDMRLDAERAEAEAAVWECAGGYAPTIGIVGAVLGLIQVMKHLESLDEVGRGVAVAFVATIYGVASANLLFLPAAAKMRALDREAAKLREMILAGVLAISQTINPRMIQVKLEHFNGDKKRPEDVPSRARVETAGAATI